MSDRFLRKVSFKEANHSFYLYLTFSRYSHNTTPAINDLSEEHEVIVLPEWSSLKDVMFTLFDTISSLRMMERNIDELE